MVVVENKLTLKKVLNLESLLPYFKYVLRGLNRLHARFCFILSKKISDAFYS